MERKLTAILCADVYGYSRLMGENEEGTLRALSACRKITDSLIERHHGRFVNSAGDSVPAEFASVVEAVNCAVDIQNALKIENASLPLGRRMNSVSESIWATSSSRAGRFTARGQCRGQTREPRRPRRHLHLWHRL